MVEVQTSGGWFARKGTGGASRVKMFREIPYSPESPGACAAELRRLLGNRGRDCRIAVWGLRGTHQALYLPQAGTAELETMARREARAGSGQAGPAGPVADGVTVGEHQEGGRREVGYISVSPAELRGRIQPFAAAGLAFGSVTTPATAHALLVRQRWAQFGEAVTAVLSVNARATAMTVVRGGVVLFGREMPWGHQTERVDRGFVFDAAAFAGQLASELRRSLVYLKQQSKVDVGHVLVCGDLPDLRALTGPLMHELNVEVETLDSLDGFDVARLPEPADEFRMRVGALRTAWVLAADAAPSVNLLPREAATVSFTSSFDAQARRRLAVAAVAGVVIAGAAWAGAEFFVRSSRTQLEALRRQVNSLGPAVQRLDDTRRTAAIVAARHAALEAFATQGPRLARVLETLAKDAPGEVVINTLAVTPGVGSWKVTVNGQAIAGSPALAQAVFNQFLRGASGSALLGVPVRPPSIKVEAEEPPGTLASADATGAGGGGGGGAALMTPRDEIAALERPRNVIVTESWNALTADERRTAELIGRRPQRVMIEPHWHLHPGGVPRQVAEGVAAYNAEQAQWEKLVLKGQGQTAVPPVERRAGSVLDFTVEFEVRK